MPITTNFLTNYNLPDTDEWKSIYLNQWELSNILVQDNTTSYSIDLITYDINKTILSTYTWSGQVLAQPYVIYTLGVGTANLQGITAPIGGVVDLTNVKYYKIVIYNSCYESTLKRKIVKNCSPYKNYRLMFLNRLGGFDFYNFNYDSKISVDIERKQYNKTLGWDYNVGDRGRSTLTIDANEQTIINTDWISEYDYNFLQELSTSPNAYIIDEENKLKLPINIVDTTWDQKTVLREVIFNMTLTFRYAYDISLQSY